MLFITNKTLYINDNQYVFDLSINQYIDWINSIEIEEKYKNTGKLLAIDNTLGKEFSKYIIYLFFNNYLKNNSLPEPQNLLDLFLKETLHKSSFPLRKKEYVMFKDTTEVKLSYLMSKFYRVYRNICFQLYDYFQFDNLGLNITIDFINNPKIKANDIIFEVIHDKDESASSNILDMSNFEKTEDIGDFLFCDVNAYIEIYTNII